jgi:hypothetical protein
MKKQIITAAVILGLGGVTIALAQQGTGTSEPRPTQAVPPPEKACDGVETDQGRLHARVAKLRAEVELLQLEHDAKKTALSQRVNDTEKAQSLLTGELARAKVESSLMRKGAESVGKADEFDQKAQTDRAELEKELEQAVVEAGGHPPDLKRAKEEFLRLTIELNAKKIELVQLEIQLEGSL